MSEPVSADGVRAAVAALTASFANGADADGWYSRTPTPEDRWLEVYGTVRVRPEGPGKARIALAVEERHLNLLGGAHGGYLLAVVDQAIFIGPEVCGIRALGGATVDVSSQFLAPVWPGRDIHVVTEVLRETKRMLFVRGLIEQDGETKLAFSGTIRKPS